MTPRPWENAGSAAYVASKSAVVAYAQTVAAGGETYALQKRYLHADGSVIWVHITVAVVSVITIFPIYWMLVSTFQPNKYTLHYPPPLFPQEPCSGGIITPPTSSQAGRSRCWFI